MKVYLILFILLLAKNSRSQNPDSVNKYPNEKTISKKNTTKDEEQYDFLKSKSDTLYLKNLVQQKNEKDGILKQILPLLGVLLGSILGWFAQAHSKKLEKTINSSNLKEGKRIETLEHIYSLINKLSLIDPSDANSILTEVNNLQKYVSNNNLYVDKPYEKIIQNISDYYKNVAIEFNNKDYSTEINYTEQFKKLFRK